MTGPAIVGPSRSYESKLSLVSPIEFIRSKLSLLDEL